MDGGDLLLNLEPEARAELLDLLSLPLVARADVIREIWMQPGRRAFADVLIDLEVDREARVELLSALRESDGARGRKGDRGDLNPQPPGPQPGALTD